MSQKALDTFLEITSSNPSGNVHNFLFKKSIH